MVTLECGNHSFGTTGMFNALLMVFKACAWASRTLGLTGTLTKKFSGVGMFSFSGCCGCGRLFAILFFTMPEVSLRIFWFCSRKHRKASSFCIGVPKDSMSHIWKVLSFSNGFHTVPTLDLLTGGLIFSLKTRLPSNISFFIDAGEWMLLFLMVVSLCLRLLWCAFLQFPCCPAKWCMWHVAWMQ